MHLAALNRRTLDSQIRCTTSHVFSKINESFKWYQFVWFDGLALQGAKSHVLDDVQPPRVHHSRWSSHRLLCWNIFSSQGMNAATVAQKVSWIWTGLGVRRLYFSTIGLSFCLESIKNGVKSFRDSYVEQGTLTFVIEMKDLELQCCIGVR